MVYKRGLVRRNTNISIWKLNFGKILIEKYPKKKDHIVWKGTRSVGISEWPKDQAGSAGSGPALTTGPLSMRVAASQCFPGDWIQFLLITKCKTTNL